MSEFSSPPPEEILAFSVRYSRRLRGRWNESDREDFAQELAIRLLRAAERFDKSRSVPWTAYSHIIARGMLLDFYSRINNNETLEWQTHHNDDDGHSVWDSLFVTEDFIDLTPSEIVKWSKQFGTTKQKVIICLALSYTQAETARILGLNERVVSNHIQGIQASILSQYAK